MSNQISHDLLTWLECNPGYHNIREIIKALPEYKYHDIVIELWDYASQGKVRLGDKWDWRATFTEDSWI